MRTIIDEVKTLIMNVKNVFKSCNSIDRMDRKTLKDYIRKFEFVEKNTTLKWNQKYVLDYSRKRLAKLGY